MHTYFDKTQGSNSRAAANRGTDSRLRQDRLQQAPPQVAQSFTRNHMQSSGTHHIATKVTNKPAVIQCAIGLGGILNYGKLVFDQTGKRYEILSSLEFLGKLQYKLGDEDGNELYVAADDDKYRLDTEYKGVMGFTGLDNPHDEGLLPQGKNKRKMADWDSDEEEDGHLAKKRKAVYSPISFSVARRDGSARTNTTFAYPQKAIQVLTQECYLNEDLAKAIVEKKDWSYPTLAKLMAIPQQNGTLQPGLSVGKNLWTRQQPTKKYDVTTSPHCDPLAQIVGCHLMEYQETNNGTQGPRQQLDRSRKQQLEFSKAILDLPSEQAASHSLGMDMPQHARLFPAMFDVKFEDSANKGFLKTAGTVTYKAFQSSLKKRKQTYTYNDTLLDKARKDRREQMKTALSDTAFDVDTMDIFKSANENFLQNQFGIKDTDSDHSQEEEEDWEFPYTEKQVAGWTLNEFCQFIFKHNVYSGVMLKENSAKLAELEIKEQSIETAMELDQIEKSRDRRKGVQNRIIQTNDTWQRIMKSLGINVNLVYSRINEWKKEYNGDKKIGRAKKKVLNKYIKMTLSQLKSQEYPTVAKYLKENL